MPSPRCHNANLFVAPPSPGLICVIDGGAARDAVRSTTCGHVFGMKCVLEYAMQHDACPQCGAALDCALLQPAEDVRDAVEALVAPCPVARCSWTGRLADVAGHAHSSECAEVHVTCPFCAAAVCEGAAFEEHKDVCPEVLALCARCGGDMPRRLLGAHEASCDVAVPPAMRAASAASNRRASVSPPMSQPVDVPSAPVAAEEPTVKSTAGEAAEVRETSAKSSNPSEQRAPSLSSIGIGLPPTSATASVLDEDDNDDLDSLAPSSEAPSPTVQLRTVAPAPAPVPAASTAAAVSPRAAAATAVPTCDAEGTAALVRVMNGGAASDDDDAAVAAMTASAVARQMLALCKQVAVLQARCGGLEADVAALRAQPLHKSPARDDVTPVVRATPQRQHTAAPSVNNVTPTPAAASVDRPALRAADTNAASGKKQVVPPPLAFTNVRKVKHGGVAAAGSAKKKAPAVAESPHTARSSSAAAGKPAKHQQQPLSARLAAKELLAARGEGRGGVSELLAAAVSRKSSKPRVIAPTMPAAGSAGQRDTNTLRHGRLSV
jgi:hypothetical protein